MAHTYIHIYTDIGGIQLVWGYLRPTPFTGFNSLLQFYINLVTDWCQAQLAVSCELIIRLFRITASPTCL